MNDPRIVPYAELLVKHSMQVKPGDKVLIRGDMLAAPLMEEIARLAWRAGAFPFTAPSWEGLQRARFTEASDEQLATVTDMDKMLITGFDCMVVIRAPENTKALTGIEVRRQAIHAKAVQPYMHHLLKHVRWVTCNYPTHALAQDADMPLDAYADFVFGACLINWQQTEAYMNGIKAVFDAAEQVRLVGPDTDLSFSIKGRNGIVCAGDKNMPDGEVFYAPVEDSTRGYITFDFPAIYQGREVDGVRLEFEQGRVVAASARKGEDFLLQILETDPGARVLGEFGIGCNFGIQRFSKDILFDEKIGGTIHLALGRAYEESGGTNQSAIHWDMIKDLRREGRMELDGQVIQENGEFRGIFAEEVK
ncbi:MAG TPA: aminopeptidase [Symbiobacteriaceae bacterium]|nr:aminopeptidase [Symbiobacteriaceae bacterium]